MCEYLDDGRGIFWGTGHDATPDKLKPQRRKRTLDAVRLTMREPATERLAPSYDLRMHEFGIEQALKDAMFVQPRDECVFPEFAVLKVKIGCALAVKPCELPGGKQPLLQIFGVQVLEVEVFEPEPRHNIVGPFRR